MRPVYPPAGASPAPWSSSDSTTEDQAGRHPGPQPGPRPMGPGYPSTGLFLVPRGDDPSTGYSGIEILNEDMLDQGMIKRRYQETLDLDDQLNIPAFALCYDGDLAQWRITPVNQSARRLLSEQRMMTEQEWATLVDSLRNLQSPAGPSD